MTMSECEHWPSDADDCCCESDVSQDGPAPPRSGLRPEGKAAVTLLYDCETSDDDEPTNPYNVVSVGSVFSNQSWRRR